MWLFGIYYKQFILRAGHNNLSVGNGLIEEGQDLRSSYAGLYAYIQSSLIFFLLALMDTYNV